MSDVDPGLCERCAEARRIESARGSRFWQCMLAQRDPRYRKYPRLPVVECDGYRAG